MNIWGEGGNHEFILGLLSLQCLCDIQALIPRGNQKQGDRSWAQVTDFGLKIQIQELISIHLEKKEKNFREYQHRRADRETVLRIPSWKSVLVLAELLFLTLSILISQFYVSQCNILQISNYIYNACSFSKDWCFIKLLFFNIYNFFLIQRTEFVTYKWY